MTTIGGTADLAALLRRELAGLRPGGVRPAERSPANAARSPGPASPSPATRSEAATAPVADDLAAAVARRVAAIDAADPHRRRKAVRAFLECVLLDEWGDALASDADFHRLVDEVLARMHAEPRLAPLLDEAAERLLAES